VTVAGHQQRRHEADQSAAGHRHISHADPRPIPQVPGDTTPPSHDRTQQRLIVTADGRNILSLGLLGPAWPPGRDERLTFEGSDAGRLDSSASGATVPG
jgi:hypothetical protein